MVIMQVEAVVVLLSEAVMELLLAQEDLVAVVQEAV
jgi:hypothetical protein